MRDDFGLEALYNRNPVCQVEGLHFLSPDSALGADNLPIRLGPGFVSVLDSTKTYANGWTGQAYADGDLEDGEAVVATVVVYKLPNGSIGIVVHDLVGALETMDPSSLDYAAFGSVVPENADHYFPIGSVVYARSGSAYALVGVTYLTRAVGAPISRKVIPNQFDGQAINTSDGAGVFRYAGCLEFEIDAADIAAADLVTDAPLPPIDGKILRVDWTVTKAITTAAKTATVALQIGSEAVTGCVDTIAGALALGASGSFELPTDKETFKPGDVVSLVGSDVTAFVEGRIKFAIHYAERVLW